MRVIKREICLEETVSRIPSMFAYIGYDDFGERVLHKATDSPDGSYGQLVESIEIPVDLDVYFENTLEHGEYKRVFNAGEVVSYRTLMYHYYKYKDTFTRKRNDYSFGNSLILFVENAIGKINCKRYKLYDGDEGFNTDQIHVPPYIYISQARKMYNEMVKTKKLCDEYNREISTDPEGEAFETRNVCCICDEYYLKGGDRMVELLLHMIEMAEDLAEEYYGYALSGQSKRADVVIPVNLSSSYNEIGYYTPYLKAWTPGQLVVKGEKFIYPDENGDMRMYGIKDNGSQETYGKYDENDELPVFDDDNFVLKEVNRWDETVELNEEIDSKLFSLRRFTTFNDKYGKSIKPVDGQDWLYNYCEGLLVNSRIKNDEVGNIGFYGNDFPVDENGYVINLMAYGDMITEISAENNDDSGEITFKYVISAHLKAKLLSTGTDDDGNILYYYDEFVVDDDSAYAENCGVTYQETYTYELDSPLYQLVSENGYEYAEYDYIQGNPVQTGTITVHFDDYKKTTERFCPERFSFYTGNARRTYDKRVYNNTVSLDYLVSDLTYTKHNAENVFDADIFKEDYLMGVLFKPTVNSNVRIERGVNAAFERHIKLGEVKTLNDMENYQNGGFFNIKEY